MAIRTRELDAPLLPVRVLYPMSGTQSAYLVLLPVRANNEPHPVGSAVWSSSLVVDIGGQLCFLGQGTLTKAVLMKWLDEHQDQARHDIQDPPWS